MNEAEYSFLEVLCMNHDCSLLIVYMISNLFVSGICSIVACVLTGVKNHFSSILLFFLLPGNSCSDDYAICRLCSTE